MERIGDVADVILVAINYRLGALGIYLIIDTFTILIALLHCIKFLKYV